MSPDDGFLLEGRTCECDDNARCANHDDEAEQAYWHDQWLAEREPTVADFEGAYEADDPKLYALLEVTS